MSLLDVVRNAVKVADKVTKPLQPKVKYYKFVADSEGYGENDTSHPSFALIEAIVEYKKKQVMKNGIEITTRATVIFLDTAKLMTVTGGAGVSTKDKIVLPDGSTGPIADIGGFMDAGTGKPVATEAYLE